MAPRGGAHGDSATSRAMSTSRSSGSTSASCNRARRWRCTTGRPTRRISWSPGEALLIVEGEERPLRAWDFVHCPAGTKHTIVGAGDGQSVVIAVGARDRSVDNPDWGGYTVDETARRHGVSVAEDTTVPDEAYAHLSRRRPARYRDGWPPA